MFTFSNSALLILRVIVSVAWVQIIIHREQFGLVEWVDFSVRVRGAKKIESESEMVVYLGNESAAESMSQLFVHMYDVFSWKNVRCSFTSIILFTNFVMVSKFTLFCSFVRVKDVENETILYLRDFVDNIHRLSFFNLTDVLIGCS